MSRSLVRPEPTDVQRRLPVDVLIGAAGLAFPLAGGRWGSYVGVAPVYLADVLMIVGSVLTLCRPGRYCPRYPRAFWFLWTATALFIAVAFLLGSGESVTRIRDLLPWIYLMMVPAVVQWSIAAGRRRTIRYLTVVLLMHAAWAIPALLGVLPELVVSGGVFGQPVFADRADIDVPLLAAAVVVVLHRWGSTPATITLGVFAGVAATAQTSRAALVGTALAVIVFALVRGILRGARGVVRMSGVLVALAFVVFALLPALASQAVNREDAGALARSGLYGSGEAAASGAGTADARVRAWRLMLDHYRDSGYPLLGVGAGAEIVRDSGALRYLSGDGSVRAPHSWWVHAVVRFGPVGLGLWIGLFVASIVRRADRGREPGGEFCTALGAQLTVSIMLAASLGVVIESPFGSHSLLVGIALLTMTWHCRDDAAPTAGGHGSGRMPAGRRGA
ncbi:MAG: O-antigen ligase family protein [Pseudonocardia sp.]